MHTPITEHLDPRAVELLRQVQQQLRDNPESYLQDRDCGSAQCIIGWMEKFAGSMNARKLMPILTRAESCFLTLNQWARLYWVGDWPTEFFDSDPTSGSEINAIPASVAIARIDHFIATNGTE